MEGERWLGRSVTLGEFWSQEWDEVEQIQGSAVLALGKWLLWREMVLLRLFSLHDSEFQFRDYVLQSLCL